MRYALTSLQKGMLAHSIGAPGTGTYIVQPVYEFNDLCIPSLEYALNKVVSHHEILRSSFHADAKEPYLEVHGDLQITIQSLDWSDNKSAFRQESLLKEFLEKDREIDFDYKSPPLIRPTAIKLDERKSLFILTHHHILLDGLSSPIVSRQVIQTYSAKKSGYVESDLEETPSYTDFLEWLAGRDSEEDRNFWKGYLKDFRPQGPLPMERRRGFANGRSSFKRWGVRVQHSLALRVDSTASDLGVAKSAVYVSALAVTCSKYLGCKDLVIGLLYNGRPVEISESDRMVGMFMNTLPLRSTLNGTRSVKSVIETTFYDQLKISEHQHISLNEIADKCSLPTDRQLINMIVDYKVSFSNRTKSNRRSSAAENSAITKSDATSMAIQSVPLHFNLESSENGLEFTVTYNESRIEGDLVPGFCTSYMHVLEQFCTDTNQQVSEVDILTVEDHSYLSRISEGPSVDIDDNCVVHKLFLAQSAKTPSAKAISCEENSYSYAQLQDKSLRLASRLLALGIGRGSTVGIQIDRSHRFGPIVLAVFCIGANYIPIDPSWPQDRVKLILEESGTQILCIDYGAETIPEFQNIEIDELFRDLESSHPLAIEKIHCSLDSKAYTLYTSGSTGRPKGISITHRVIASRIICDQFPLKENEVIVSKTSFSFVDFLWELFLPLVKGHQCQIVPTDACRDPLRLISYLSSPNTKRIVLVPSLLAVIIELAEEDIEKLIHIEYWFSTGEPLQASLAFRFYAKLPNAKLYNLYGSSEVWDISIWPVPKDISQNSPIFSGKPLPNTSVFILDEEYGLLPPGVIGNITVAGDHLLSEYSGTKRDDSEGITTIDIGGRNHKVWNSGDKGYWDKSGNLMLVGRADNLVKIRGFRVDLNEIESVAKQSESVKDVVASQTSSGYIAMSVLVDSADTDIEALKHHLRKSLASYMLPSKWRVYSEFPYLSSGKVDRRLLAEAFAQKEGREVSSSSDYLTDTEAEVLKLAKEILRDESITIESDFFQSGGHSLAAVRILSRLSKELGKTITLESVFDYPRLRDLCEYIDGLDTRLTDLRERRDYTDLAPASAAQRRLWIVDSLSKNKDTYILTTLVKAHEITDIHVLRRAVELLAKRHSVLRTSFVDIDGQPYQQVHEDLEIHIEERRETCDGQEVVSCLTGKESIQWDLTRAPLFQVTLIRDAGSNSSILLRIHHIIADGISVKIFFDDLISIYRSIASGRDPYERLPELTIQYKDYSIWQYDYSKSVDYARHLDSWDRLLSSRSNQVEFLEDNYGLCTADINDSITLESRIGPKIVYRLRSLARNNKTTLFTVLLSVFGIYISRHTAESKVNIGSPITGRTSEELQSLIGFFVNVTVYPLTISEEDSFNEYLAKTGSLVRDVLKTQSIQFDELVRHISPDRDSSGQPLFQVMLVHEVASDSYAENGRFVRSAFITDRANYDYLLLVREHDEYIELIHHARQKIFAKPRLNAMIRRLNTLLSRLSRDPQIPIYKVSMLPYDQRQRYVVKWNSTSLYNGYSSDSIASIFSELTQASPNKPCIYDGGLVWSRNEVYNLAVSIQQIILSERIPPNQIVGLILNKSVEQVAAVIALNGLGHSFVPIDPDCPDQRMTSILETTASRLVLTNSSSATLQRTLTQLKVIDLSKIATTSEVSQKRRKKLRIDGLPEDNCYVCFTSGSTGVPKGVVVTNRNLMSLFHAHSQYFLINEKSRILSTLGFYFDAGIGEQVRAILSGATLYFCGDKVLQDPEQLYTLLQDKRISHVGIPPSVLQSLEPDVSKTLSDLRVLVTAGESLPISTAMIWGKNRTIITGHGATETTIGDTISVNWDLAKRAPLGRPLPNMRAFVLDKYMQPCPPYVIGELAITGPQVTKGYLGNHGKTLSSFKDQLPSIESEYQFYLTGDFVYADHRGVLYFISRRDTQIKIRGHRIDVTEIERAALSIVGVSQAVCVPFKVGSMQQLALYYVTEVGDISDILTSLRRTLPGYMIPCQAIRIDKVPISPNGKVDSRLLPSPDSHIGGIEYSPPISTTEIRLHDIWSQTLGISRISIDAGFFVIGGDSIQAVQLLTKCLKEGIQLTPSDLLNNQTIRTLAEYIDTLQPPH